jgi:hypothetical protein
VTKPDFVEVSRKAHELSVAHGRNAAKYALKLAAEALAEGKVDEFEFWKSVASSLTPRVTSRDSNGCAS